jgi:predicted nucleic acid-binding protein
VRCCQKLHAVTLHAVTHTAAAAAAAAEREVKREMLSEAGGSIVIPDVKRFDSNIITPVSSQQSAWCNRLRLQHHHSVGSQQCS